MCWMQVGILTFFLSCDLKKIVVRAKKIARIGVKIDCEWSYGKLLTSVSSYLRSSIMRMLSGLWHLYLDNFHHHHHYHYHNQPQEKWHPAIQNTVVLYTQISVAQLFACWIDFQHYRMSCISMKNEEHLKCFNFAHPLTCERTHTHLAFRTFAPNNRKCMGDFISIAIVIIMILLYAYIFARQPLQKSACMDGRIRSDPIWSKIYMTCKIHPIYTHNAGNFRKFRCDFTLFKRKPFYAKCSSSFGNFYYSTYINTPPHPLALSVCLYLSLITNTVYKKNTSPQTYTPTHRCRHTHFVLKCACHTKVCDLYWFH